MGCHKSGALSVKILPRRTNFNITGNAGPPEEQNIPWGHGGCDRNCFANEPPGSSICYALRETSRVFVDFPWTVVPDDPHDEIFYSTCFRTDSAKEFDGPTCGPVCAPPKAELATPTGETGIAGSVVVEKCGRHDVFGGEKKAKLAF